MDSTTPSTSTPGALSSEDQERLRMLMRNVGHVASPADIMRCTPQETLRAVHDVLAALSESERASTMDGVDDAAARGRERIIDWLTFGIANQLHALNAAEDTLREVIPPANLSARPLHWDVSLGDAFQLACDAAGVTATWRDTIADHHDRDCLPAELVEAVLHDVPNLIDRLAETLDQTRDEIRARAFRAGELSELTAGDVRSAIIDMTQNDLL